MVPMLTLAMSALMPSAAAAQSDAEQRTLILFDRSASMIQPYGGVRKIDLAKQLFRDLANQLKDDPQVAIRFFAGGTTRDKSIDCQASEIGLGFGGVRTTVSLESFVDDVTAIGYETPITFALEQARSDLADWPGPRKIILISDGEETCDRDPEELAELFFEDGITIDTIGIGPPDAFSQLGMIALSGGGGFQLAENLDSLKGAFDNSLPGGALNFGAPGKARQLPGPAAPATAAPVAAASVAPPVSAPNIVALPAVPSIGLPETEEVPAGAALAVEIIFDASGSMAAWLGDQTKLALAKDALRAAAEGLDNERLLVAFRAYGFDEALAKTAEASCPNTELLMPFSNSGQAADVTQRADELVAYGYTPIARSLELAGQDLSAVAAARRMIILISDGEETCDGDPQAVARALKAQGIDLQTHVVGFDLDEVARVQMSEIAREGGGNYYDANNGAELGENLIRVIELAQEAADPWGARVIHPIIGGETLESAISITAGAYTLDKDLLRGEERFFKVDTSIAQRGLLRAIIQSRKIIFGNDGDASESGIAYGGFEIRLYRPDTTEVKGHWARVYGERGEQAHTAYVDLTGDGFFFSIGNQYDTVNKDALFQLEIDEAGDLIERQDAPADNSRALSADISMPITGHLGLEDREDIYGLALTNPTRNINIRVRFTDPDFRFQLDLRDAATGRRIERFTGLTGEMDASVSLPPETNTATLRIRDNNPSLNTEFSSYTITIN
ncbi:MAG: VWA domain-containing protein [Woeseia sp.]|nr:VWA domain-containing protein [Woeseia sp.]